MTVIRQYKIGGGAPQGGGNPLGMLGGLIMLAVTLLLAYFVISGIFKLLYYIAPILLIAGILVDPKGALSLGKQVVKISRRNPLIPLAIIGLSVISFPTVLGIIAALTGTFLLTKAMVKKKIKSLFQQAEVPPEKEVFVEYEEVKEEEEFLELPPVEPEIIKKGSNRNEYDDMF